MVRTLPFHGKNVGSIPTRITQMKYFQNYYNYQVRSNLISQFQIKSRNQILSFSNFDISINYKKIKSHKIMAFFILFLLISQKPFFSKTLKFKVKSSFKKKYELHNYNIHLKRSKKLLFLDKLITVSLSNALTFRKLENYTTTDGKWYIKLPYITMFQEVDFVYGSKTEWNFLDKHFTIYLIFQNVEKKTENLFFLRHFQIPLIK